MPANKPARRQRGAVLLILLAVLALAGASLLISAFGGNSGENRRIHKTQLLLAEATDALTGYAAANGRLPRPAVSATDGRERPQPCASDEQCTGFLPWVALGVAGEDAWGKRLRYSVTPAFTSYAYQPATAAATRTVQQRGADGELHYVAGGPACTAQLRCAALVVLSHGKHNHGTSVLGVEQANAGPDADGGDEAVNATASTHFITRPASSKPNAPGGEFDDQLAWLSLQTLYARMRAARTLPN
jgi:type II secretory pathway pseudopilin PulG